MNHKKIFLCTIIDKADIGKGFSRSAWPLHVTFVPWFVCGQPVALDGALAKTAKNNRPFYIKVGKKTMFGSKKNIAVNLIEPNKTLIRLHHELLEIASSYGQIVVKEPFIRKDFRPHITHSAGRQRTDGESIKIKTIELVELTDNSTCTPIKRYNLSE